MTVNEDVSVILPNFNHARFLPQSIEAVLNQTVRPRELIVIDDASTDESNEVIEQYARSDSLIRVIRNERNLGVFESLNRHLAEVRGEYLITAGADDFLAPNMIEKSMAMLRQYPHAGMSTAWHSEYIQSTGKFNPNPNRWCETPRYFSPDEMARVIGPTGLPSHPAVFKREEFLRSGTLRQQLRWHADWLQNLIVAFRTGVCIIPEPLAWLRVYDNSYSNAGMHGAEQTHVVGTILRTVLSPDLRDILNLFQVSSILGSFGADLIRAAAQLPEPYDPTILRLINGLPDTTYASLLDEPDCEVRTLAELLLGSPWRQHHRQEVNDWLIAQRIATVAGERDRAIRERDQFVRERNQAILERDQVIHERELARCEKYTLACERNNVADERDRALVEIEWMRNSRFWKIRDAFQAVKRRIGRLLGGPMKSR